MPRTLPACVLTGLLAVFVVAAPWAGRAAEKSTASTTSSAHKTTHKAARKAKVRKKARRKVTRRHRRHSTARGRSIKRAFVASSELRPMAQQLATMRSPAAYAGVTAYAHKHSGEAAAAAYLALGHAYMLDKRYADAADVLAKARVHGKLLDDYAAYLEAQAAHAAGDDAAAEQLLRNFDKHHPDSIFEDEAPILEANVLLAMKNPAGAKLVLAQVAGSHAAQSPEYELAHGQVEAALGHTDTADHILRELLLDHPLSEAAQTARSQLKADGSIENLTIAEKRSLGDAYYRAHRYSDAAEQYHALARQSSLDQQTRNTLAVAAAACDLKLKRLTRVQAEALPDTADDNGARRLYLLMELARNRDDEDAQQSIVDSMEKRFPQSQWLADALLSSGNMYLLKTDYAKAVEYYSYLADHFPRDDKAVAAHWRAAWLEYRLGQFKDAARMFEEHIKRYPDDPNTAAALYWRGRLYETQDHDASRAAANYRTVVRAYRHYFYAHLARQRLAALGDTEPAPSPELAGFTEPDIPALDDDFPDDSVHLAKAKLLANAGLNEYIPREIAADPDSGSWSALAEARIYASYGETFRALRALKRAMPYASTAPIDSIPLAYWRILFPEPYWSTIKAQSARYDLDPYLVASLIRQESEFNPSVVSYADAYGLMQLLPSVGRAMAREEGLHNFRTFQLLDPETNIRLGTRYLRKMLDKFGDVQVYALAAYNAGDNRVVDWKANGPYTGMDEFVESIPFTQTRDYVQAILRNVETYKAIDAAATRKGGEAAGR